MHEIYNLRLLLFAAMAAFILPQVHAQGKPSENEVPPLGYLRFVNATGYAGKLHVELDGNNINPAGYNNGQATGAVGFVPKDCQIVFSHDALGKADVSVKLKLGEVCTVIALAVVKEKDKTTAIGASAAEEEKPEVELTSFIHTDTAFVNGNKPKLTLLQTTIAENLDFNVGSQSVACSRMKPASVPLPGGDFLDVSIGEKKQLSMNVSDPSDRVVVFFTDEKGILKNVHFDNKVF